MNDLLTDPKAWFLGLLAILGGIVAWFFQRELARIDKAIADSVKRDEFNQLREDMDGRHQENKETLGEIKEGITGTHRRMDDLYQKLPEMIRNSR